MKREEYLGKLKLTLQQNDFQQVEEAIAYFDEMLQDRMADDGLAEDDAVSTMEEPEQVAARLKESPEEEREAEKTPVSGAETPFDGIRTIRVRVDQARFIRVRDRNTRLIVRGGAGNEIVIRHPETERIRYTFSLEDGRLSLLREPLELSFRMFSFDILSREMREVTLELPEDLAAELDLRTSNAKLTLEGFGCWGQIAAATSNASLVARDVQAKRMELSAGNGALNLSRLRVRQDLKASTSNGKITAEDVKAPQSLTLKTSNGSIVVSGLDSGDITLLTSNGAVKGSLPGKPEDYAITSATSNGRSSLPRERAGGSRKLSVRTSNGSIGLDFDAGH